MLAVILGSNEAQMKIFFSVISFFVFPRDQNRNPTGIETRGYDFQFRDVIHYSTLASKLIAFGLPKWSLVSVQTRITSMFHRDMAVSFFIQRDIVLYIHC